MSHCITYFFFLNWAMILTFMVIALCPNHYTYLSTYYYAVVITLFVHFRAIWIGSLKSTYWFSSCSSLYPFSKFFVEAVEFRSCVDKSITITLSSSYSVIINLSSDESPSSGSGSWDRPRLVVGGGSTEGKVPNKLLWV